MLDLEDQEEMLLGCASHQLINCYCDVNLKPIPMEDPKLWTSSPTTKAALAVSTTLYDFVENLLLIADRLEEAEFRNRLDEFWVNRKKESSADKDQIEMVIELSNNKVPVAQISAITSLHIRAIGRLRRNLRLYGLVGA